MRDLWLRRTRALAQRVESSCGPCWIAAHHLEDALRRQQVGRCVEELRDIRQNSRGEVRRAWIGSPCQNRRKTVDDRARRRGVARAERFEERRCERRGGAQPG